MAGLHGALGGISDDESVELDLSLDAVPDGIAVTGTVKGILHLVCSRCLVGFDARFDNLVDEVFYARNRQGADEDDAYRVVDDHVDLEPMLRDVIVLGMPLVPLHDDACRGLCPTCGADRNTGDCGHSQQPTDLRWAPLEALRSALGSQEP